MKISLISFDIKGGVCTHHFTTSRHSHSKAASCTSTGKSATAARRGSFLEIVSAWKKDPIPCELIRSMCIIFQMECWCCFCIFFLFFWMTNWAALLAGYVTVSIKQHLFTDALTSWAWWRDRKAELQFQRQGGSRESPSVWSLLWWIDHFRREISTIRETFWICALQPIQVCMRPLLSQHEPLSGQRSKEERSPVVVKEESTHNKAKRNKSF